MKLFRPKTDMEKYKTFKVLIFWLVLVSSDTVAQLMLKVGAVKTASSGWVPNYLILSGYSLYIVSFVAWMQILKNTRLFIALSAASLLYITIPFASHFYLGETLTPSLLTGALFIAAGVLVLGLRENKS
jgi:drug/metabolite transporter (DMT)-like permease